MFGGPKGGAGEIPVPLWGRGCVAAPFLFQFFHQALQGLPGFMEEFQFLFQENFPILCGEEKLPLPFIERLLILPFLLGVPGNFPQAALHGAIFLLGEKHLPGVSLEIF